MKKSLPSLSEVYNLLDQEDSQKDATVLSSMDISQQPFTSLNLRVLDNISPHLLLENLENLEAISEKIVLIVLTVTV